MRKTCFVFGRHLPMLGNLMACAVSVLSNPLVKLIALGLVWAIMHHAVAGVRYLLLDTHYKVSKEGGHQTAIVVFAVSLLLTAIVAVKMFI